MGITGIPALAIVAAAWVVTSATERMSARRETQFASHLRQVEARFSAALAAQAALDLDLRNHRVKVYGELWTRRLLRPRTAACANAGGGSTGPGAYEWQSDSRTATGGQRKAGQSSFDPVAYGQYYQPKKERAKESEYDLYCPARSCKWLFGRGSVQQ